MVGILLFVHGSYGESLITCASHVLGTHPQQCVALPVKNHDNMETVLPRLKVCIDALNTGNGVLVMTDMYGATPSNIIKDFLVKGQVEAVAGASLPMLIRALTYRELPLEHVVEKAVSGGREGTVHFNENGCDHYLK